MNIPIETKLAAGGAPPLQSVLITVDQFCEYIQCGRTKAHELMRTRRVRSVLIGRSRRILLADAERLVAEALMKGEER